MSWLWLLMISHNIGHAEISNQQNLPAFVRLLRATQAPPNVTVNVSNELIYQVGKEITKEYFRLGDNMHIKSSDSKNALKIGVVGKRVIEKSKVNFEGVDRKDSPSENGRALLGAGIVSVIDSQNFHNLNGQLSMKPIEPEKLKMLEFSAVFSNGAKENRDLVYAYKATLLKWIIDGRLSVADSRRPQFKSEFKAEVQKLSNEITYAEFVMTSGNAKALSVQFQPQSMGFGQDPGADLPVVGQRFPPNPNMNCPHYSVRFWMGNPPHSCWQIRYKCVPERTTLMEMDFCLAGSGAKCLPKPPYRKCAG